MFLYFPSVKIVKLDKLPSVSLLYLKSTIVSPKHYPKHPLIDGKLEFVGKINNQNYQDFNTNKPTTEILKKGEIISVIIELKENQKNNLPAISLVSYGIKNDKANRFLYVLANEQLSDALFLDYFLKVNNKKEQKKIKI